MWGSCRDVSSSHRRMNKVLSKWGRFLQQHKLQDSIPGTKGGSPSCIAECTAIIRLETTDCISALYGNFSNKVSLESEAFRTLGNKGPVRSEINSYERHWAWLERLQADCLIRDKVIHCSGNVLLAYFLKHVVLLNGKQLGPKVGKQLVVMRLYDPWYT